ncbi:MliC family protein [Rheinheimera salexigens]|uniref:C-type lysozyme inhibitor domain-containing protein n=1 Tax=Rheinheimera salexigens TaxID=1628148 RepID=A0A1E7Q5S3_9GAMM|nr:MliC family protein [Rheinheimera salexigens]OEY69423.1 hypothetical protein BI198_07480 [Rheinheimera salexigens]
MKIFIPSLLAATLLMSGCDNATQDKVAVQTPEVAPSAMVHYQCESGEQIAATYNSTDTAQVQYQGKKHHMQIDVSGSGSRYVGGGFEWWTKTTSQGAEGTLFQHQADGSTGESLELCTEL